MSRKRRSQLMSRIRGRDTGPEVRIRKELWARGVRYRLRSGLPGKPDIVIAKAQVVIFVDGCFWHGCRHHFVMPDTRRPFWKHKIETNRTRDRKVRAKLRRLGWRVVRVWEHEIRKDVARAAERVYRAIRSTGSR